MKKTFFNQQTIHKVLLASLVLITNTFLYAQLEKTYISSQSKQISGGCLLCTVDNPQNMLGNDEGDYATLKVPIGIAAKIEQSLIFPKLAPAYRKITIGIETPNVSIKEQAKREIYIETYNGTASNNDKKRVDNTMLIPSVDPQKGILEFTATRPFDQIKLYVHSGLLGLGEELRIYYVQHLPAQFTSCGNPPLDPLYYYPFNGDTKDIINGKDMVSTDSNSPNFQQGLVCNNDFLDMTSKGVSLQTTPVIPSLSSGSKTISFWAKAPNSFSSQLIIDLFKMAIVITPFMATARQFPIPSQNFYALIKNNPEQLNNFTIVYDKNVNMICIYKNAVFKGDKGQPCVKVYPGEEILNNPIKLNTFNMKIDELIIYDRVLNLQEIHDLVTSYNQPLNMAPNTTTKAISSEEILTISPNPTFGQITLDGNILMLGSEISIRNTSGTEVYHSPFKLKTFDLPASLPGGVYMLTLQTKDKKIYTRKIILTR